MAETFDIAVKVISQNGTCGAGHRVGDEYVIGGKSPEGICLSAFNVLLPNTMVLRFGGSFPWENDSDVTTIACPDAQNAVVFELRQLRK